MIAWSLLLLVHADLHVKVPRTIPVWPRPSDWSIGNESLAVSCLEIQFTGSKLVRNAIKRTRFFASGCPTDCMDAAQLQINLPENRHWDDPGSFVDQSEDYELQLPLQGTWSLNASTPLGVLRGLETLSQLIVPKTPVPHSVLKQGCLSPTGDSVLSDQELGFHVHNVPISIRDSPRFTHRGLMLDTARHYISLPTLFKILDGMAHSKLNVFHWHLIDSQSFPLQSDVFPNLSHNGAYSKFQVYSKQDIKRLIQYAASRGIRVIPEFDMPGHAYIWSRSFPELVVCAGKQPWPDYCAEPPCGQLDISKNETLDVISKFLQEQRDWFDDPYLHMGNDEVNLACYSNDTGVLSRLAQTGSNVTKMVQDFHVFTSNVLSSKTPVYWEEMITDFHPNDYQGWTDKVIVQVWQGTDSISDLVSKGFRVIASPSSEWYLDCGRGSFVTDGDSWCDPFKTWVTIYNYDPTSGIPEPLHHLILGGETALWTETVNEDNVMSTLFPRVAAAAEALWTSFPLNGSLSKDWNEAVYRLDGFIDHIKARGIPSSPIWPPFCSNGLCATSSQLSN